MSTKSKYTRIRSASSKAVGVVAASALAVSLMPAAALAVTPDAGVVATGVQNARLAADAGDAQDVQKVAYGIAMTAAVSGTDEITITGYEGGEVRSRKGSTTYDAMANPKVTVKSGENVLVDAAAIGEGGKVALSAAVSVGSYVATITSDNYTDKTISFDYPAMSKTTIGGVSYEYLDASTALQYVDTEAQQAVLAEYARIADTSLYYKASDPAKALSGTLYGMSLQGATKYSSYYGGLGLKGLASSDYDTVSSATKFTSHHAGDISPLVAKDMDTGTITGVYATPAKTDDVQGYVEASILKAAGKELSAAQEKLLGSIRLNGNAMVDPATVTDRVALDTETTTGFCTGYTYFTQYYSMPNKHYGNTKITIRPKAGAAGDTYSWSDYYSSLYAATIADGNGNVVGMAPWIDLYAESGHGAVEIAINNGQNYFADNGAATYRYADMYDANTGRLKAGTYTVTLYAAGYNNLVYTFDITAASPSEDLMSIELQNAGDTTGATATVTSIVDPNAEDASAATATVYAADVAVTDGKIALDAVLPRGKDVKVSVTKDGTTYDYTLTVPKLQQVIAASNITKTFGAAAFNLGAKLTVGDGAMSYSSSNAKVASVDKNGKVTIKGAGKATVTVKAAESDECYAAEKTVNIVVNKAANSLSVKSAGTTKIKVKKLKKKAQKIAAKKVLTVKGAKGAVTYKKMSGNKKITVASNGAVTVKKGLKKGTYSVTVRVTAKGDANYKSASKQAKFKVKVVK